MRVTHFSIAVPLIFVALSGCAKDSSDDESGDTSPGDTGESGVLPCLADFTITMPDGTSTNLDFCVRSSMEAAFEFDPDDPPEVRNPILEFHAVTDEAFECWVRIAEPAACGEGYYRIDGSSGTVTFDLHDCTGVGDEYEATFDANSGYIRMDTFHAGDEPGNFSGKPLETRMAGYVSVTTVEGITLTGDFSQRAELTATDAEEAACAVSNGDADADGYVDAYFEGDDCDDTSADLNPADLDEDGLSTCDGDCDDSDSKLNLDDADNDGFSTCEGDCDDSDGSLNLDDVDEDGYSTCDGDCDDSNSSLEPADLDNDGVSICDGDCDDNDSESTTMAEDADCDGTLTLEDCDDASTHIGACFVHLSSGESHSCAVKASGAIECFGSASYSADVPPTGTGYVATSAGRYHSCALTSGGAIECWGRKDGDPYYDQGQVSDTPTGTGYVAISSGPMYNCALSAAGAIECWGGPADLQTDMPTGTGYVAVTAGWRPCVLTSTGIIECWGGDFAAPTGSGYTNVSSGGQATCALTASGAIECQGEDYLGQVSNAPTSNGFTAVSVGGESHACALTSSGEISCWGQYPGSSLIPTWGGYIDVSAGRDHSCALTDLGVVECWGTNFNDLESFTAAP